MLVLLVVIICALILYQMWKNKELIKLSWQMPNLSMWLIIKNYYSLTKGISEMGLLAFLQYFLFDVFKTSFTIWLGSNLYVIIKDPEDYRKVFNSPHCLNRAPFYEYFKCVATYGLAVLNMPEWKKSRKMLAPNFSVTSIESFIPTFNEQTKIFTSLLEGLCNKNVPTDIFEHTNPLTLDTILLNLTGKEVNTQKGGNTDFFEHVNNILSSLGKRIHNILLHWTPIYRMTSLYKSESKSCEFIVETYKKIIDEKTVEWKAEQQKTQKCNNVDKPKILIDQLLHVHINEKALNEEQLLGEIITIFSAGSETTALSSAFCILMLAMHPKLQDRLHDEIISGNLNDDVGIDDFHKCDFLDRFIKETLRLFPALPMFGRTVTQAIKLGNYIIPPETNIGGSIFALHRDKEIWGPNADEFDPDRFLPDVFDKIHPYAYLPFGGGPRIYLGIKYADFFLKTILIHTVRNFKFRTDLKMIDIRYRMDITLKLDNKHMVFVEKRDT